MLQSIIVARLLVGLVGLVLSNNTLAKELNSREFGPYRVYFNALPTDFLTPEVAQLYKITRSRNRILLNVAVKTKVNNTELATSAEVKVHAKNLLGQITTTEIRPIQEGTAIYYIAEFSVTHRELLHFTLEFKPSASRETYVVKFSQDFYTR